MKKFCVHAPISSLMLLAVDQDDVDVEMLTLAFSTMHGPKPRITIG
jgi:hypothetical protein